jgi:TonB family protein
MIRCIALLCCAFAIPSAGAAQTEPVLSSAKVPKYPTLACQARVEGTVRLTFTLPANATEPTNIEAVSGHPILKGEAIENVKTWRFDNPYAVERKYETTFKYRLSGVEVVGTKKLTVTFDSFRYVEVLTDSPVTTVNAY